MIKSALTILSVLLKLTSLSGLRIQLFICVIDMICIRVLVLEYDADMYQNSDDDDDDDDTYNIRLIECAPYITIMSLFGIISCSNT